ncbi:MAG: hypothetical protein NTY45_10725 [Elusimicrobia bacterium]|nr:hypothetical protein [Elusimicrobiota bacterium]
MSEFDAFVVLLNRWTGLVEEAACVPAVRAALSGTMRFYMDSDNSRRELSLYGDLSGFIRIYTDSVPAGHPRAGELKAAGRELLTFLETRLIMNNIAFGKNEAGRSMADAHGLSIHLPALRGDREAAEKYLGGKYTYLSFIKNSRWYEFVNYLWASMPPPPGAGQPSKITAPA